MSNVSIGFDVTAPADGDGAGFGAGQIRSFKTAIQTGLNAEHVWPSSPGNAGAHRAGSARAYVGPASQVSSVDTDGRMLLDTTNNRLWAVGSTQTYPIGGMRVVHVGSSATVPVGTCYGMNLSTYGPIAPGTTLITNIPMNGSGCSFIGLPNIQVTVLTDSTNTLPLATAVDPSNFAAFSLMNVRMANYKGAGSNSTCSLSVMISGLMAV